jgi:hypothetical protein
MLVSYQQAISEIVRYTDPGTQFERDAITEVANEHGDDPRNVALDVKVARICK